MKNDVLKKGVLQFLPADFQKYDRLVRAPKTANMSPAQVSAIFLFK